VSLYSWLQKLLGGVAPGRRKASNRGLETTVDYPATSTISTELESSSPVAPGTLKLRYGVVSAVGTVREHNEDRYYVPDRMGGASGSSGIGGGGVGGGLGGSGFGFIPFETRETVPPALFIVADGMGGQQAGEKASSMAVEHLPDEIFKRLASSAAQDDEKLVLRAIKEAVANINQEILSLASIETEFTNMGTTVVLALLHKDRVYITGIGDSRAYRLRDNRFEQLTRDHSLADALGEAGTITREEVATHKFKNVLYLYLGSKDARGGPEEVRVMDVCRGDRFLMATDGLTGVVKDERLAEVLRTHDDPQETAQVLVSEALENGSKDNVTCEVIHVVVA